MDCLFIRKNGGENISKTEEHLRRLINNAQDIILEMDLKGHFTFGNRSAEKVTGYKIEQLLKMNMRDIVAPPYHKKVESRLKKRREEKEIQAPLQIKIIRKDGRHVPMEVITSPVIEDDKIVAVQGVARDLTKYRKIQTDLEEAEKKWNALFSRSLDWVYIHDLKGRFLEANDPALKGLGYTKEEINQINFKSLLPRKEIFKAYRTLQELKKTGVQKKLSQFKLKRKDGTYIYVETKGTVIFRKGKPQYILGIARDITKRIQMEAQLKSINKKLKIKALTDDLTGLLNHGAVLNRLKDEVERAERQKEPVSVLIADLDHFKTINDKYGHQVGDRVLKHVSHCIHKSFRAYDIKGRYGGEEFLIVMPNTRQKNARKAAERLRKMLRESPVQVKGRNIPSTISIGLVSSYPHQDQIDEETLLKLSDTALYRAKEMGRDRVEAFKQPL
ncbi:MAG: sensor domain-containing diguanylate cyclase [Acidobacteriota bacterium]